MVSLNSQSIVSKASQLEYVLLCYDPHVVVITETWLSADVLDDDVFPATYKTHRRDRKSRGGGVAILVKTGITAVILDNIQDNESVCCEINMLRD